MAMLHTGCWDIEVVWRKMYRDGAFVRGRAGLLVPFPQGKRKSAAPFSLEIEGIWGASVLRYETFTMHTIPPELETPDDFYAFFRENTPRRDGRIFLVLNHANDGIFLDDLAAQIADMAPPCEGPQLSVIMPFSRTPRTARIETIRVLGPTAAVACDGRCDKAWGVPSRPVVQSGDTVEFLADGELSTAPVDPGTREGSDGKPSYPVAHVNRWCALKCERSVIVRIDEQNAVRLPDWSVRRATAPVQKTRSAAVSDVVQAAVHEALFLFGVVCNDECREERRASALRDMDLLLSSADVRQQLRVVLAAPEKSVHFAGRADTANLVSALRMQLDAIDARAVAK